MWVEPMISIVIPIRDSAHVALMLLEETAAGLYWVSTCWISTLYDFLKKMLDIDCLCLVLSESK